MLRRKKPGSLSWGVKGGPGTHAKDGISGQAQTLSRGSAYRHSPGSHYHTRGKSRNRGKRASVMLSNQTAVSTLANATWCEMAAGSDQDPSSQYIIIIIIIKREKYIALEL